MYLSAFTTCFAVAFFVFVFVLHTNALCTPLSFHTFRCMRRVSPHGCMGSPCLNGRRHVHRTLLQSHKGYTRKPVFSFCILLSSTSQSQSPSTLSSLLVLSYSFANFTCDSSAFIHMRARSLLRNVHIGSQVLYFEKKRLVSSLFTATSYIAMRNVENEIPKSFAL